MMTLPVEWMMRGPLCTRVRCGHCQPQRAQRQMTLPKIFRPIESKRTPQCFTGRLLLCWRWRSPSFISIPIELSRRKSVSRSVSSKTRFSAVRLIIALDFARIFSVGGFDSFPPPPQFPRVFCEREYPRPRIVPAMRGPSGFSSAPHLQSLKHPAPKSWQPIIQRARDAAARWRVTIITYALPAHATRHAMRTGALSSAPISLEIPVLGCARNHSE